jgi:cytochrome c oxidase subunit 3
VLIGTINTAVLLTSSFTMALAAEMRRTAPRAAGWLLAATASLGAVFLILKGIEYRNEWHEQLVPGVAFVFAEPHRNAGELFFYLYFAMTGVHALHLTVGIGIVASMSALMLRGRAFKVSPDSIDVTALYWHFVDVVWIFLYPILYLTGRAT